MPKLRLPTARIRLTGSVGALLMAGALNGAYGQAANPASGGSSDLSLRQSFGTGTTQTGQSTGQQGAGSTAGTSTAPTVGAGTSMPLGPPGESGQPSGGQSGAQSDAFGDDPDSAPGRPGTRPPPGPFTSTNYGKPRKMPDKRLAYKGRPKTATRPLPTLVPYPGSPQAKRPVDPIAYPPPPQANYAQQPGIPRKKPPVVDPTPYAPLGIDVGSLRLKPFVETSGGYDSNPNRTANVNSPKGSTLLRLDAGVQAQSNWANHELRADIRGGYSRFTTSPEANRPDGTGTVNLRVDATRDTQLNFELRGSLTTQRPGTPGLPTSLEGRPLVATYGASSGITQKFGRLEASITGLVDRVHYEDGRLNNGTPVRLSDNNYNTYGLRGRLAYELTPGIIPFAEVTVDTRKRDKPIDDSGFARNSNGVLARLGSTFEFTRTLTGQISGGYGQRKYDDARLPNLNGPAIDASLIWTATPLTTVTLRGTTNFFETTLAGASGAISRTGSVEVSHALLRNLTIGMTASLTNNQYRGVSLNENYYTAGLKAEYSLTRSIVIKGSYTFERLHSSQVGADYTANVFLLGLRFQR